MSATADQLRPGYAYRTPGVHFEWLDRPRAIAELRTDVAGFVGIAARGPLHEPVRLESWNQFTSSFGAHVAQGYLAYAVEAFFANGGRTCWAVRAADPLAARAATLRLDDDAGNAALELSATSPGTWGHDITVSLTRLSPELFALAVRTSDGATEVWRNLSMDLDDPRYVVEVLRGPGGSRLIVARTIGPPFPARVPNARSPRLRFGTGRLAGGQDGLATLEPGHLSGDGSPLDRPWGLRTLEEVDEVAIVAMPDAMAKPRVVVRHRQPSPPRCEDPESEPAPPPAPEDDDDFPPPFDDDDLARLQLALMRHCATLGDRFAVLDPRPGDTSPDRMLAWRAEFDPSARASQYAALYYPWILAPDPLSLEGPLRPVPPSGHVAGIFARSDLRVGVHKPPANEPLENCNALTASTDDARHGDLNDAGVNVIRTVGARIRLAAARTLSSDPSWRYINVRRLLSMIEEAIDEGTAWSVFEPNAPPLWREIDRVARSFLDGLWRRGMLDGATPDEAYLVRCDETTNPPDERDVGRMSCLVGVLPPWPAEFVIVRIGTTQGATRGVPDAENDNG